MTDEDSSNWTFENRFKICSYSMYIVRTHPFVTRNKVWLYQFIFMTVVNVLCIFFITNSIFGHDIPSENYADACKNFSMLLIMINSNIKYYTMLNYQESIANLIKSMDRDYEIVKQFNEIEKSIVSAYSQRGNKVCKFWMTIGVVTNFLFPGKAIILMIYYNLKGESQLVPMFNMTFPYFIERFKEETWAFCGIFGLCFLYDVYALFVHLGFEPLIPIFNLHTCGQLELLSLEIKKVISESNGEQEILQKLRVINVRLQELHRFIDHVQNNFMLIMEFNMKTTIIALPCNAFRQVQDFREGVVNVEFVTLFIATVVHFYTPCYYSDVLMETSEKFRQAVYSCGWENCRYISVRKSVLLMLTRTSKPFSISSIFYFISLDTFSAMCHQAYAIFNLMSAAWD